MSKLLFLTSQDTSAAASIVNSLLKNCQTCSVDVRFENTPRTAKSRLKAQLRHLKRNGILWIPYRVFSACLDLLELLRSKSTSAAQPLTLLESEEYFHRTFGDRFTLEVIDSFHADNFLKFVAAKHYDVGVVFGTRILKRSLFSLPSFGMMNIHQGLIPDYRGMPPAFWEMYNGETQTGVSIHEVTDVLDGGDIFAQETLPINYRHSLAELQSALDTLAAKMLPSVVNAILMKSVSRTKPELERGRCYSQPTVVERIRFYWRLHRRR